MVAEFRAESDNHTLVHGYLRTTIARGSFVRGCQRALRMYCERNRLRLCSVFVDRLADPSQVDAPGFGGLCDVLSLPDSFAAVVIDAAHLSPDQAVRAVLARRLTATGARLIIARDPQTQGRDPGNGPSNLVRPDEL
jgi:hypothetical protein